LNVHGVSDSGQTKVHRAEPLVPEPETEIAIAKLGSYEPPGTDQILAKLYKQEVIQHTLRFICSLS
jgi:hypothetical protein